MRTLFVPLDHSSGAGTTLRQACRFARMVGGKIHLMAIIELVYDPTASVGLIGGTVEYMAPLPVVPPVEEMDAERSRKQAEAEVALDRARRLCEEEGIPCETASSIGYPEEEILAMAARVDLLVIGRGQPAEEHDPVGRLVRTIIRHSPQPVFLAARDNIVIDQVIVLDDGDERALHALALAAEIVGLSHLPLRIMTAARSQEEAEQVQARSRSYLKDHGIDFESERVLCRHELEKGITTRLASFPGALIVMGAYGDSRVRELLAGSTTEAIVKGIANPLLLLPH